MDPETPPITSSGTVQKSPDAPQTGGAAQSGMMTLVMLLPMILIMYFLIIRPQQKQQKERTKLLGGLKVGDTVLTSGGMYGVITKMGEKAVKVKLAQNVEVKMDRSGITGIAKDIEV